MSIEWTNERFYRTSSQSHSALSIWVISLTKISPHRHMDGRKGWKYYYYFLTKSNKRLSDTLVLLSAEMKFVTNASYRGNNGDGGGNKRRETIPIRLAGVSEAKREERPWIEGTDEWQVRPFLESRVYPGPLIRYFIGHNLPFTGRHIPLSWRNESGAWYRWLYLASPLEPVVFGEIVWQEKDRTNACYQCVSL